MNDKDQNQKQITRTLQTFFTSFIFPTANKQKSHTVHTERFNLKKLNELKVKSNFVSRSQIGLQLWKI
jgi:hypothetical protein